MRDIILTLIVTFDMGGTTRNGLHCYLVVFRGL